MSGTRDQINSLVIRVTAANAVIAREIARLELQAASEGGDLTALTAAIDSLTALADAHATGPERTAGSVLELAQAAKDRTTKAAADAAKALDDVKAVGLNVSPGAAEASTVMRMADPVKPVKP